MRPTKIGLLGLACVAALLITLSLVSRRPPATLLIHADSLPWQTIIVDSANLSTPARFARSRGEPRLSPISHGAYRIGIELATGQTIWSEFFHTDAGTRRRIDIVVTPATNGFHFHQTANLTQELFDGEARPADVSPQKPFRLDWI